MRKRIVTPERHDGQQHERGTGERQAEVAGRDLPCGRPVSLATHWGGGLYWLVPAGLLGIAGAVYSAWVLLVEIVR